MDTSFIGYLAKKAGCQRLVEVSEYFPRAEMNRLFQQEVEKVLDTQSKHLYPAPDPAVLAELEDMRSIDVVLYLDRALRRAGFRDPDLDALVHDILVKMLVTGNLFAGYRGGSFRARFVVSVRNAISTLLTKKQKQSRRNRELHPDLASTAGESSGVIDAFRNYLQSQIGPKAVSVLDQRLQGGDTKELLGQPGLETSYRLKKVVSSVKQALKRFDSDDKEFQDQIAKAFQDEAKTLERRFPGANR